MGTGRFLLKKLLPHAPRLLADSTDRITALVAGCVALAGQASGERK